MNVWQGPNREQNRSFGYDNLNRLISEQHPEVVNSGAQVAVTYRYDNNGNMTQRTAPKPGSQTLQYVHTSVAYDALNRPISVSYDDGA